LHLRAPHGIAHTEENTEDIVRAGDWRFLLPRSDSLRYRRLAVLGASPGLLRGLSALGLADDVTAVLPIDGSASAVAVLPGHAVDPAALARSLAAGGVLYMEVNRRAKGNGRWSPANLEHALRRSGLVPLGIYAVGRRGLAPRRYMPLDEPGAAIWFLRNSYRPVTVLQRLAAAAATALLRARLHRSLIHPLLPQYAMTAVARNANALPLALDVVSPSDVPRLSPAPRLVLFGDGGDRVVAMPFANGDARPTVVIKMPRAPAFRARTEHEQARMLELRAALPPELARAIPEPLGITRSDPWAATERAMPGRTLLASSGSRGATMRRRLADLRLAAGWLASYHVAPVQERRRWGSRETDEWLASYFTRFANAYGESPAESALRSRAMAEAERLAGLRVPVVWQHRDYAVWNLARVGDSLSVLDWEGARLGPPLCDLLHLVVTWDTVIRRPEEQAQELDHFDALLLRDPGDDPYRRAARGAIDRYMTRLNVDGRLFPILLLHHRLELAVRRADQIVDQGLTPVDPRAGNAWVGGVERLAAAPDLLFGPRTH
jgi:aminoglycoside phosphotransferase (APT) family kinase protein